VKATLCAVDFCHLTHLEQSKSSCPLHLDRDSFEWSLLLLYLQSSPMALVQSSPMALAIRMFLLVLAASLHVISNQVRALVWNFHHYFNLNRSLFQHELANEDFCLAYVVMSLQSLSRRPHHTLTRQPYYREQAVIKVQSLSQRPMHRPMRPSFSSQWHFCYFLASLQWIKQILKWPNFCLFSALYQPRYLWPCSDAQRAKYWAG